MIILKPRTRIGHAGATIVEVLVAIALTGIFMPVLATALVAAHAGRASSIQQLQAQSLLKEASEAVRSIREKGWTNVATDGTYHAVPGASDWSLASGPETINGFTRQIVISTPQRNAADTIVASGGTNDPSTKHVVITVSWTKPTSGSLSTDAYLSRWQANAVWSQTTQADFTGDTLTNTCATNTCDTNTAFLTDSAYLQDSPATWQLPSVFGGYNLSTNTTGNDIFVATISGVPYAFLGYATGLAILNISNPASPTLTGTYTTTAAVNGVFVSGTTAYLATSITNGQLVTVNVANPAAPALLKNFQITDTNNVAATAVYVSGTTAVVTKKKVGKALLFNTYGEINTVNVSNPAAPSLSDSINVGSDCNNVWVNGTTAYIGTSVTNAQLNIVNIATPTNITSSATVNLGANTASVVINSATSTAYIATANNTSTGEVRIYHLNSATSLTSQGSYEVGGNATGLGLDTGNPDYLAVTSGVAGRQLMILNVTSPTAPTLVNNITLSNTGNTVRIYGSYAYVGDADNAKEMTVVYSGYRPSGTIESSSFDPGANVGYNYFTFTGTAPAGTTLQFQIAANNVGSGWSYVGPDGTASTYYTSSGKIPLSLVSNRYFRYKAYLTTTNGQVSPKIDDVEVNYSP
ncbi:MAG TPA: hypothetical protein VN031_01735 [Candidatus Microsaccharimonas sp.]|nr:hypothetical protein [Candidatus Microsaccharimonas sp.]